MTQHARTRLPAARIALLIAALAAAFAVGLAISRSDGGGADGIAHGDAVSPTQDLAGLERAAEAKPADPDAWQRLGAAYFAEERYANAARAYGRATRIAPGEAEAWSALGEALVMASEHDPMPGEALSAFKKAVALDAKDPRARYFLAVKKDLGGDHEGAITDWLALLAETPRDAPWREDLIRTIQQVGAINGIETGQRVAEAGVRSPAPSAPVAAQPIPGPNAQDLAAASAIPPDEQREMAEGMVSRLEARLKSNPGNIDGWVMLMRSRMTLDQPDKARKALTDAVAANPEKADFLKQQAALVGVE